MRILGVEHDAFTFPIMIRGVSSIRSDIEHVGMLHCLGMQMGFGQDVYFCNALIDAYVKCGRVERGRDVFDEMCYRDLVSWTSMIMGYVLESGFVVYGFDLFGQMRVELEPNLVTIIVMLRACSSVGSACVGKQFHCFVTKKGFMADGIVQNSVLRLYTEMGCVEEVLKIVSEIDKRDAVTWNTLISFYCSRGDVDRVGDSFNQMQNEMASPSVETLTLVISAFAKYGGLSQGEMMHCFAIKTGLCDIVLQTSLLDLYSKCGELDASVRLFEETSSWTSITLSALMCGYIQNGYFREAVEIFQQIQAAGLELGAEIFRNLVAAYTNLGALQLGKGVHGYLIKNLYYFSREDISPLETSILNMYIKCGSISSAKKCFDPIVRKDIVTWTSMIEGLGSHGLGFEAVKLFQLMLEEGIQPNSVSFLSLFSACSHSGLLNEGCQAFQNMKLRYSITPDLDHCTCIVDLLGRSGMLKEALMIILKMVVFPDSRIWGALLAASRVHGEAKIGDYAAKRLLELEHDNVGYYTMLSNIHASIGRWDEVEELREIMSEKELKKKPGWSCIETKGRIRGFVSGDRSHDKVEDTYEILRCLGNNMKDFGYFVHN